jgi:hypothetical protein
MIVLVSETRKLHNISHFSLLMRLALIFREKRVSFHKILTRKIAKRDSLPTLIAASAKSQDIK